MKIDKLSTIRYMGIKTALLEYIIPEIISITPRDGTVLDLMAGSNVVSYSLKRNFTIYTNDVQAYSNTISKAVIVNNDSFISSESAIKDLSENYSKNKKKKTFNFFFKTYSFTYFSDIQCEDIDSIIYAIEFVKNDNKKNLYLLALMCAMCKVQSTPGHFAQYMPSTHSRIIPLQQMDLFAEFLSKCDNYSDLVMTKKNNIAFCQDYKELFKNPIIALNVDTIYLDSPYSQEQYSRFYHILETVVKYDSPEVNFKAKYRDNRFQSNFCYKRKVQNEFLEIIKFCSINNINLVISYSNKALLSVDNLLNICQQHFNNVSLKEIDYKHSSQGKGNNKIKEVLITCRN